MIVLIMMKINIRTSKIFNTKNIINKIKMINMYKINFNYHIIKVNCTYIVLSKIITKYLIIKTKGCFFTTTLEESNCSFTYNSFAIIKNTLIPFDNFYHSIIICFSNKINKISISIRITKAIRRQIINNCLSSKCIIISRARNSSS